MGLESGHAVGTEWELDHFINRTRLGLRVDCRLVVVAYIRIAAHKLRASFATIAGRLDIPRGLLKCYMGHSTGDVLGDHYQQVDLADLRAVPNAMEGWRDNANRVSKSGALDARDVISR